jgi:hypothetical protein
MRFDLLPEWTNRASPGFVAFKTGAGRPGCDEGNVFTPRHQRYVEELRPAVFHGHDQYRSCVRNTYNP